MDRFGPMKNPLISNLHQCALNAVLIVVLAGNYPTQAQQAEASGQSAIDSVAVLRSILEEKRSDRARLDRMLSALNSVDSVYRVHFPTWVVRDEDLRQRIYKVFRGRFSDLAPDTAVTVVANPEQSEILQVSIGKAIMGPQETRIVLK